MISVHPYRCKTWSEAKREWGWLMRSKGLQQINRNAPTGYGEAPDLLKGKVEGSALSSTRATTTRVKRPTP